MRAGEDARQGPPTGQPGSSGCAYQVAAVVFLVVAIGLLLAWYVATFGRLPFTWADGPFGVPVWVPLAVLAGWTSLAVLAPRIIKATRGPDTTFIQQIATNRRNCLFLTAAIAGGLGLTTYAIVAMVTLRTTPAVAASLSAILAALLIAYVSLQEGDRIALAMSKAVPARGRRYEQAANVVQELSAAVGLPPPALYAIDDSAPNAFSIGRDPQHAALAVTSGLVTALNREELQGVVAHELAHIRNQDTRYSLFVAVLVGTTVLVAETFFKVVTFPFQLMRGLFRARPAADGTAGGGVGDLHFPSFGGGGGGDGGGGDGGGDGDGGGLGIVVAIIIFVLLVLLVALLVHILSPVFARLVQASVSREREYLADATAVEIGRNPRALEQALLKVARSKEVLEVANRATAPLYFVNPIRAFEPRAEEIYSVHPPTIDRVNRLRSLLGQPPIATDAPQARTAEDQD